MLNVCLTYGHARLPGFIQAVVDSGSPYCLFHSNFCKRLGIRRLEDGVLAPLKGVIGGQESPESSMYFHKVKILIGSDQFETMAGFCDDLAVAAILGRHGFFENFTVKFDCSEHPPTLEIERIHRS